MRIRTIKPEFWVHPVMGRLSDLAKWLSIALLNLADDEGYFLADPAVVRGAIAPYCEDLASIHGALTECSRAGWIELKTDDGHGLIGKIAKFSTHQVINRANPSKLKTYWNSMNTHGVLTEYSLAEGRGREGKGREEEQGGEFEGNRASTGRPPDVQPPSAVTVDRTGPDRTDHNQTTPAAPSALPAGAGGNGRRTTKRPRTFLTVEKQALFDRFYAVYPRKVARGSAEKAWAALRPDEALTGRMIASLETQIRSPDWPSDPKFIPHPATWLRSRRWEDEVAAKPTAETWNMRG